MSERFVAQASLPCAGLPDSHQLRPSRRTFLGVLASGAAAASSSSAFATATMRAHAHGTRSPEAITLYSSVDDAFLREIVDLFHRQHAQRYEVKIVGDTEATKTTGLVQRLIAEKDAPRADVWWSSEALGTAMLAREGVIAPHRPATIEQDLPVGTAWPAELVHERWTGFACRARVIVVNTKRVPEAESPTRLRDFTEPKWRGRIGIARPQFGTTRGQFAALLAEHGETAFGNWLQGLKANSVKLFDGNATVVRACASGEIDVGLTDTDDVWAGLARGWPVAMVFETRERDGDANTGPEATPHHSQLPQGEREESRRTTDVNRQSGLRSVGPLVIPNTVGLVARGPNPEGARTLIDFLLSPGIERALARSESKNLPMRPGVAAEFPVTCVPAAWTTDWSMVLESLPRAMALVEESLP